MDKDKKKVIVGAGVLSGAALIYLLTRKKAPVEPVCTFGETKCIGTDLYECSVQGQWVLSVAGSPTCDVPTGMAILDGQVTNAHTGVAIENIQVSCNSYSGTTEADGRYRIEDISPAECEVTFTDPSGWYETKKMTINLVEGVNSLDIALQPSSAPPVTEGWTKGVNVQKVIVIPRIAYLGESVEIRVLTLNCNLPIPTTVHGTLVIDGTTLTGEWHVSSQNPTFKFTYTPTQAGTFTVGGAGKSATFTVLDDTPSTYYSPFGKRVPLCTDILIPDVAPFTTSLPTFAHPGGDLIWSTLPLCSGKVGPDAAYYCHYYGDPLHTFSNFWLPHARKWDPAKAQFPKGQPRAWNPPDAVVSNWVGDYKSGLTPTLIITATEYSCQEYWDTKKELSAHLVRAGLGTVAICGGGYCTPQILCPYCDQWLYDKPHIQAGAWDRLSFVREFLLHIETVHPDHPLTEPSWS